MRLAIFLEQTVIIFTLKLVENDPNFQTVVVQQTAPAPAPQAPVYQPPPVVQQARVSAKKMERTSKFDGHPNLGTGGTNRYQQQCRWWWRSSTILVEYFEKYSTILTSENFQKFPNISKIKKTLWKNCAFY